MIRITDEAMLNGATPMFIMRVSVVGASFVCGVGKTIFEPLSSWAGSHAAKSSNGSPKLSEAKWAVSEAAIFLLATSCSTKLLFVVFAVALRVSASSWCSRPACTKARARPGSTVVERQRP